MLTCRAHLARLAALADASGADVRRLTDGLTDTELLWQPAPERWSIAACLEHLVATGAAYHPRIQAALAAAPRSSANAERPWRPSWFGRLFVRYAGPETRSTRVRARGAFIPPPARADAPERLLAQQGELQALLADAPTADLRAIRITSPIARLVSLRLGEALEVLVVHQQRHLLQAWEVHHALPSRNP